MLSKTRTFDLALSLFGDITSMTYLDLNFEPIISPVNKDSMFD